MSDDRKNALHGIPRDELLVSGDIVDELPLAQSTVAQHLRVLKDAGLIQATTPQSTRREPVGTGIVNYR